MPNRINELMEVLRVPPGKKIDLQKDYDPDFTGKDLGKEEAAEMLTEGVRLLAQEQDKLYAQDNYSLLMVLQAMDAAGKDGTIRHVMSGVNPQGVDVHSYKAPAGEEADHDYMWRNFRDLPRRGHIGIFNRSHYEEVLVVRVHPEFLAAEKLPPNLKDGKIWKRRFEQINNFEKYLVENGTLVLKFFLNISKDAQREQFLQRIRTPEKNWKFSAADLKERAHWDEYMAAFEDMLNHTSTEWAPWYVIPANNKWFTRLAVGAILLHSLQELHLAYPEVTEEQRQALLAAGEELAKESGQTFDPSQVSVSKKGKGKKKSGKKSEKKKK